MFTTKVERNNEQFTEKRHTKTNILTPTNRREKWTLQNVQEPLQKNE